MVDVDKAVIARLRKEGSVFEILVDCDLALEYKAGAEVDIESVIATDDIYEDVKKGLHASENKIKKVFETNDKKEVIKKIIKEGHIQLTVEHQRKLREKKINKILDLISRNAVDPKTNVPHPRQRIENAMNEVKIRIDDFKSAEVQIKDIVAKIRTVLPIRYEIKQILLVLPAQFVGKGQVILRRFGKLNKESWLNDGSFSCEVEVPVGLYESFERELNSLTHGSIDMKIIGTK